MLIFIVEISHNSNQIILIIFSPSRRHVQVNNSSAIEFYKQFDFEIVETKQHYYKRIEPADAYVLQKNLNKKSSTSSSSANSLSAAINAVSISSNGLLGDANHHLPQQQPQHGGKTKA